MRLLGIGGYRPSNDIRAARRWALLPTRILFGAGNPRASLAPGAGVTIPLINPAWNSSNAIAASVPELNKAAFVFPANMTYGNTPLRIAQLRGPKTINEDIALLKNFNVTEKTLLRVPALGIQCAEPAHISRTRHEYGELYLRIDHQPPRQHATKCPAGDEVLFLIRKAKMSAEAQVAGGGRNPADRYPWIFRTDCW